jgi:hypothetical protein
VTSEAADEVERLPFVDEHAVEIAAEPERVWTALVDRMGRSGRGSERAAALLGCRDRRGAGDPERAGSTIVGFRVVRSDRPAELALAGRHRFSSYSLTFAIDDLGGGRSRLRAATRAAFPGVTGAAYRALVIGSRAHVGVVRSMLSGVRARAESAAA